MKYVNGEEVAQERIQDEPWYSMYQTMLQLHVYGDDQDIETEDHLVKAFKTDWEDDGSGGYPSDERLRNWAKACLNPKGGAMLTEAEWTALDKS